ncbi:MAG: VirB4 family type IV secretion system protein [Eubacteriaceae bacterium]
MKDRRIVIPENFSVKGKVFKYLYIRNLVETTIMLFLIGYLELKVVSLSLNLKLILMVLTCLPLLIFGITGIRGYSLIQYAMIFIGFHKNKRKLKYRRILKRVKIKNNKKKKKPHTEENEEENVINNGYEENFKDKSFNYLQKLLENIIPSSVRENRSQQFFTQQALPFKKIQHGIIVTRDNRYVKILEILPLNLRSLSDEEFEQVKQSYQSWMNISPNSYQLKIITSKANQNEYLNYLKNFQSNEKEDKVYRFREVYINYVATLATTSLERRAFIIYEYDEMNPKYVSFEEIYSDLVTQEQKIVSAFREMGNTVISYDSESESKKRTLEILYFHLNKRSNEETFKERYRRVYEDTKRVKKALNFDDEQLDMRDLVSPKGIDFTNADYEFTDGVYKSYFSIDPESISSEVYFGWVDNLTNLGEGFDLDIFIRKQNNRIIEERIERKLGDTEIKVNKESGNTTTGYALLNKHEAGKEILRALANKDQFYYFAIVLTIYGETLTQLKKRLATAKSKLRKLNRMQVFKTSHQKEAFFNATMPLNKIEGSIFEKIKRNSLSEGVASLYPFTNSQSVDTEGIIVGLSNNYEVERMDLFNTARYLNGNLFCVGSSGAGKTYLLSMIATRYRLLDVPVVIVSPIKGHEFASVCKKLGGSFVSFAPGSGNCINIMGITEFSRGNSIHLDGDEYKISPYQEQINDIKLFFKSIKEDFDAKDAAKLDRYLVITYSKFGIYANDRNSIYLNKDGQTLKRMPILGDLYEALVESNECQDLVEALEPFVSGTYSDFNQQTNVDMSNKFTVIDLSSFRKELIPVGMILAMAHIRAFMNFDITQKKIVVFEELWHFFKENRNSNEIGEFIQTIVKVIRGLGGAVLFGTQDLKDLDKNNYTRSILSSCYTKILLYLEPQEIDIGVNLLGLNEKQKMEVASFVPKEGEPRRGIIITGRESRTINIIASREEHETFTTKRDELLDLALRNKEKRAE